MEGTLANKIENVNKKFSTYHYKDINGFVQVPVNAVDGCYAVKNNNTIFLKVSVQFKDQLAPGGIFFSLPEGFRPAWAVKCPAASYVSGSTQARVVYIGPNGNMTIDFGAYAEEWLFVYTSYFTKK